MDGGKRASASGDSEEDGDEEEEDGDYFDGDRYTIQGSGETPRHHRRNSLQGIHLDADEDGVQQPFFNPLYKFAQNSSNDNSSGISASGGANDSCSGSSGSPSGNSFAFLRNHTKSPGQIEGPGTRSNSSTSSACGNLVHRRSASGIALSVDDDSQSDRSRSSLGYPPSNNSGNISYSPSPPLTSNTPNDHIYSSLTDIHELHIGKEGGRLDPFKLGDTTGSSDVVLVEVIRKQGNGNGTIIVSSENKTGSGNKKGASVFGEKYKLEKFGSVELIQKLGTSPTNVSQQTKLGKRHSVDVVDSAVSNKISNAKVEANPGKVQRFKESLKRFGRFGRSNTDKIVRAHSDSGFSTDDVQGGVDPKKSPERIKRQASEGEANSLYENPSEIIVTSLKETENDKGITVKPAPRKRSKQLEASASSPENFYTALTNSSPVCSELTSGSEPSSPPKFHKQIDTDNETVDGLTDCELPKNEECEFKNGTKSPEHSDSDTKTAILAEITSSNDKSDRVSPTASARKLRGQEIDDDDDLDDDGTRIPHLEFDKGGENENSTSHDESCSSRAESLTYSSTSHEQDRSMPQQIVQLNQQRCVIPKVDKVKRSNGEEEKYRAGSPTSIESGSSDTLNCEVTPVIRKRSSIIEKAREQDQQEISAPGGGPGSSCQNEDDGQCSSLIKNNKQPVTKQISSSFVESSNNNNYSGGGNSLQKEDGYEKVAEDFKKSISSLSSASNNEDDCCEKEIETTTVEVEVSREIPVTLNEPSDNASGEGDPDASTSPSGTPNMHPFIRTRCKISSREMYNGGQQNTKSDLKPNLYSDEDNRNVNGTEGPEIMASKVENNSASGDRNGMGKLGELLFLLLDNWN